jgi:hypothetical protein
MYIGSEHYKLVKAATAVSSITKTAKKTYVNRTDQKNYHIMRHVFERLRDTCGVFDGYREKVNYSKTGAPKKLKPGSPESQFDIHVILWQEELIKQGLLEPEEMISPASVLMHIRWAITKQPANKSFRIAHAAFMRRAAVNAYWLLTADLVEIEKSNFFGVTSSEFVTPDPEEA